ncbi:MAG: PAS domain-containing sensor histidine kinase [Sphingobacteriaceae bacterium]|nr:PAS domain-containing sensor histidine kinase [Sphingobacteriaceae bacterium]
MINNDTADIFKAESIQDFIDNATIGIHSVDGTGKIIYANKAELKLLGYDASEYLGRNIQDFHADKDSIENIFLKLTGVSEVKEHPAKLICKDGSIKHVLINSSGYYQNGTLIHTRCFTRDITEHFKDKSALKESKVNMRFMADTMPQQVWTARPDGSLDYVNKRVTENFESSVEEIIGEGWIHFVHSQDQDNCIERWKSSLQSGEPYQVEFRLKVNEEYRWHLGRAIPLVIDGSIVKWFGTNTDIHEHKVSEEKKDAFISIASHELKTPLTNIKSFVQLAKRTIEPSGKAFEFLTKADNHVLNLQNLISDLLDVSKFNAGMLTYNFSDFNFADLVSESIEAIKPGLTTHKIILENHADVIFNGDRFRIEQVIANFLSNALKYSPDADTVIVRTAIEEGNIVVEIQDFGIGIPEEHLSKIFERFYRVDNTSMKFQGLGLGLFISSVIIKRHQGSFWIESKPGAGSTFHFLLPLTLSQPDLDIETDNETFYKSDFIDIKYNNELKQLDVNWTGFQNIDTVKAGGMVMLQLLKFNGCAKVLNDNTFVKGNWSEAADWAGQVWFPMMEEAGLEVFAWIYSPITFSALAARKSVNVMVGNVVSRFFTSTQEAQIWLSSYTGSPGQKKG